MSPFDSATIGFLQQFSRQSWTFDRVVYVLFSNSLLKTVPYAALLWGLWWWQDEKHRDRVAATFAASLIGVLATQVLILVLPFRPRPLCDPALGFRVPLDSGDLIALHSFGDHSSFPSDHAALFAALATGIFFVSRKLGVLLWIHCLLIVCLPRVYLGVHYPTDIVAGAAIGAVTACLAQERRVRRLLAAPALALSRSQPAVFYSSAFIITSQMTVLFADLRNLGSNVVHAAQRFLGVG
jgi:undecaprenyl-diphosphatase